MKKIAFVIVVALLASLGAVAWITRAPKIGSGGELVVYCAAGLKTPVEQIAADYQRETGTAVRLRYGGTGTLLSAIRVAGTGDIFISADATGVDDARKFGQIHEVIPLLKQYPVIAVRAGNPLKIKSFADLSRGDVRLAMTNPEAAAVGRAVKAALGDKYPPLAARAAVLKPTVTEIAADVRVGAADAAVVWDSTVPQFKGLEAVSVPELSSIVSSASAAILVHTRQAPSALRFARYLAAPEKGGLVFSQHGFTSDGGDHWAASPELILYSGGVNRPAIEPILREFSEREGVRMTTVFNGCGILCAAMKAMTDSSNPKFPDAYYACDLCFVPPVADHFPQTLILTQTEIGIAVPKGNPRGIHSPADLTQPNLRLGLCNAEQSTLGYMTEGILAHSGVEAGVRKNVAVETPTADFLINELRSGALDAAIVYRVNALLQVAHLDFIPIDFPGAIARQPFSIRRDSPNRQLAGRLLDFLKEHRANFERAGFQWRGDEAPIASDKIQIPDWLVPKRGTSK